MVNDVIFTLKLTLTASVVSLYFKNILLIFCSLVIIPNVNLILCIVLLEIVNILIGTEIIEYYC